MTWFPLVLSCCPLFSALSSHFTPVSVLNLIPKQGEFYEDEFRERDVDKLGSSGVFVPSSSSSSSSAEAKQAAPEVKAKQEPGTTGVASAAAAAAPTLVAAPAPMDDSDDIAPTRPDKKPWLSV